MSNTKVLYVDDESINLKLFDAVLKRKFEILTAENGITGLDILKENSDIQVVISDMKMPVMNGITFIHQAREIWPQINYYILTGFEITDQMQDALDNGVIRKYFKKPVNLNEISEEIEKMTS